VLANSEVHRVEQFHRPSIERVEAGFGAPEVEGRAELALQADAHVLQRVRCGKVAEIWKERTTPRRAICAGFSAVMSWPSKVMGPASAAGTWSAG
jgi:hypothetical protein